MSDSLPRVRCVLVYQTSSSDPGGFTRDTLLRLGRLYPDTPVFVAGISPESAVPGGDSAPFEILPQPERDLFGCAKEVLEKTGVYEQDSVAVFRDWAPLLDVELARKMQADHFRFLAHYTYCDNVPPGFLPDLASLEFVRAVAPDEIGATDLREFVFKNVNRFDVEIFYRLPDLRQFRLDVSSASVRSRRLVESIRTDAPELTFVGMEDFIRSRPELLRPFPSYIELELTRTTPCQPVFLPRPEDFGDTAPGDPVSRTALGERLGPHLDPELVDRLLADLGGVALEEGRVVNAGEPGEVSIALGGPGEPLLHPQFVRIAAKCLDHPAIRRVYLETFGADLTPELARDLAALPGAKKLCIIVRLATLNADRYRTLYGADLLETVLASLAALEAGDDWPFAVYVEMPRLADNADEVDALFERFAGSRIEILLGKFNSYAGRLPEMRAADLTPLHRDFCWHLARDFYVTAEGRVTFCKQDPFAKIAPAFDLRETGIAAVLAQTADAFAASVAARHDDLPMPCSRCDEWYTFNG